MKLEKLITDIIHVSKSVETHQNEYFKVLDEEEKLRSKLKDFETLFKMFFNRELMVRALLDYVEKELYDEKRKFNMNLENFKNITNVVNEHMDKINENKE